MRTSWLLGGVIAVAASIGAWHTPSRFVPSALMADVVVPRAESLAATPTPQPETASATVPNALRGEVMEAIPVTNYVYLRLRTPTGEAWAAVPSSNVALHSVVEVVGATAMPSFKSKTLNRTFEVIYFGTLANGAALENHAASETNAALPPGHPALLPTAPAVENEQAPALPPGHPDIGNASTECAKTGTCSKLPAGHPSLGGDWRDVVSNMTDEQDGVEN